MPFQIGQVFSPEALALLERKREFDQTQALENAKFSMSRVARKDNNANEARQLDLSYARLGGENQDRALRSVMAAAENARSNRSMDLSAREQGFRESQGAQQNAMEDRRLAESTRQFGVESGMRAEDQKYQREHGNRQIELSASAQKFEQGPEFDMKKKASEALAGYHSAVAGETAGAHDERARTARANVLVSQMKAISSMLTGGASGIPMDEKSPQYASAIQAVQKIMDELNGIGLDPQEVASAGGPGAAPSSAAPSSAMDVLNGLPDKPPALPRGR